MKNLTLIILLLTINCGNPDPEGSNNNKVNKDSDNIEQNISNNLNEDNTETEPTHENLPIKDNDEQKDTQIDNNLNDSVENENINTSQKNQNKGNSEIRITPVNEDKDENKPKIKAKWINNKNDKSQIINYTINLCEGSVVFFEGDAIVNAANEGCLGGGGVDGAISTAGGDILYRLREEIPLISGSKHVRCPTGEAKITESGKNDSPQNNVTNKNTLKSDYVIHAVGPNYSTMSKDKFADADILLKKAYVSTMKIAKDNNLKSIGFCLLSSGIFAGSRSVEDIIKIGVEAIKDNVYDGAEIYLIAYKKEEFQKLQKVLNIIFNLPTETFE
ncbi:MAG: hypothetical protein GY830_04770 [Bacteroidetes bacterium]|nr:hypothetical protein [Bacteroidota bacterium]